MKRYYLSKIKGDGSFENPFRHRIQEYPGVEYLGGEIAVHPLGHPDAGKPVTKALLVLVGGVNHIPYQADPELVPMPDASADMKVAAIHTSTKLACKAKAKSFGFGDVDTEVVWGNADGLRDVLNHYGRLNNPNFDCNNFDLTDL